MLDLIFSGTSIRFTANNLYRLMVSLFPPSAEVCSRMCKQGFVDALKFLINNGRILFASFSLTIYFFLSLFFLYPSIMCRIVNDIIILIKLNIS